MKNRHQHTRERQLNGESGFSGLAAGLVVFLVAVFLTLTASGGEADHDHGGHSPGGAAQTTEVTDGRCQVSPKRLADFANGESYDFPNLVTFITQPSCRASSREISRAAVAQGVDFTPDPPFKLSQYASSISKTDLESARNVDIALSKTVPQILRGELPDAKRMLPIIGQLSLLSGKAAQTALTYVINQEIATGDQRLQSAASYEKPQVSSQLAAALVRLGANTPMIAGELASSVEEMVLLQQGDTVAGYFRALAAASGVESSLVPTFQASSAAASRGAKKAAKMNPNGEVLKALFIALQATLETGSGLENSLGDFNDALEALLLGRALTDSQLKVLWQAVVRLLSSTPTQSGLADAVARGLTPSVMYLKEGSRAEFLRAALQYPQLARQLQRQFIDGYEQMWSRMHSRTMAVAAFNRIQAQYYRPYVAGILDLNPEDIDLVWARYCMDQQLVGNEDVERRFPKVVLSLLSREARNSENVEFIATDVDRGIASLARKLNLSYSLQTVLIPALDEWIASYENRAKPE